ncbi:uncharacterized protein RB166_003122 [Leptodactylus fuscus]|uniref:uncharacterized protein LOC142189468 n=1 Tax=Leptodactylus fuscus TaxID=238119 RepID=UPI003F4EFCDC
MRQDLKTEPSSSECESSDNEQSRSNRTLLLTVSNDGTMRIGLMPKHHQDSYYDRAVVIGKLENVSHVICSPEGEMFCVWGADLYRGPLPSTEGVDWFSKAKRVGKGVWNKFSFLFFHPNGELYGITYQGEFYKGPQPDNENIPWMYEEATQIGVTTHGWATLEALCFDPNGVLYAITTDDKLVKGKPPTKQSYDEWLKTTTMLGEGGWKDLSYFMSFSSKGKLWCIDKKKGNIYKGFIPDDGRYIDNAEHLGWDYNLFRFLCFTKDKTIRNIISFDFLPEQGQRVSETPEVIEEKIYDNRESSTILKHTFMFDKTVKASSSFSHEHGFTFAVGASLTFKAGIPCISETEARVSMNLSTTNTWKFTETNETEVKFSSKSDVEVSSGKAIRVVASVVKADLIVPYRARVRTLFGAETEVTGTWNGATHYNLMVKQKDYNK